MTLDQSKQFTHHWNPNAKIGFWLFTAVYFIAFVLFFLVSTTDSNAQGSLEPIQHQPTFVRTLLSAFLSFFPTLLSAPFLGVHLGRVLYTSRIRFWTQAAVSGLLSGFLFVYWTLLVFNLSKVIGIAPPGTEATNAQELLIYPLLLSIPFIAINLTLALVLYFVYKCRPNPPLNSDPIAAR